MRSRAPRREMVIVKLLSALLLLVLTVCFSDPLTGWMAGCFGSLRAQGEAARVTVSRTETKKKENETEIRAENTAVTEPYRTPADILRMQNEFIASYSEEDVAGAVTETFFVNNGATDVIGNIAVKNTTAALSPDFRELLERRAELRVEDPSAPVVLIFHTHTTESYLQVDDGSFYSGYETRSRDPAENMVRVGDAICEELQANGIGFIHDTTVYDESYNGAYARSREGVLKYLEQYPSIKIVLDVHRDAIYSSDTEHLKPAAEIDGRKAAQIMIITGAQDSGIADFPDWEYNLRFALELQKTAQDRHEGLMKPIYFCPRKYNMDTARCSLLLEVGSDANTLEEAVYAAHLLGGVLSELIGNHAV